jgi:D-glycero-D-manno-heptose 1,7-bisphosphate phosphatase
VDKFYFCPHSPDEGCDCRKPKIALFKRAIKDFDVDIKKSFIIGDKISDVLPAEQLGCKAFLLEKPRNLKSVVNTILGREN